jgi:hypothetical protein
LPCIAVVSAPCIFLDSCNMRGPQLQLTFRGGATHPPYLRSDNRFRRKDKTPRGEGMMRATFNRTKMFHVKHFGTIGPRTGQTRAWKTLSNLALVKLSPGPLAVQGIDHAVDEIGLEQAFGGELPAQRTQALLRCRNLILAR